MVVSRNRASAVLWWKLARRSDYAFQQQMHLMKNETCPVEM